MKKKYSTLPTAEKVQLLHDFLEMHKGQNITCLNLSHQNSFAEAMLVVSAASIRHAQSLAENVVLYCKEQNFEFLRTEGKQSGQWILLDCNDIIINIFQTTVRDLYKLETLWTQTPDFAQNNTLK